jgi:addiction module RelE/StbE family toxin
MNDFHFKIFWTYHAKQDLKDIYIYLKENVSIVIAKKIRNEIYQSPTEITFPEQFQLDGYRFDCRRIIIRDYKILYCIKDDAIYVVRVFNTLQNPLKSLL